MASPDRLALVVGCGSYDDPSLQALQATLTDVAEVEAVLRDPAICGFTSCAAIVDRSKAQVEREVHRFLKSAPFDSVVLLYFTGHGIKDELGTLYIAQKDTECDLLESTAVSSEFIRRQMDACVSDRKLLLLDCCFAGAFPRGAKAALGPVDLERQFAVAGAGRAYFVISATGEYQYAYSDGEAVEALRGAQPSLFTRHLVNGLKTGEADSDDNGIIKVGELFDYVSRKVRAERAGQTPKIILGDFEEDFVLGFAQPRAGEDVVKPLVIDPAEAMAGTELNIDGIPIVVEPGTREEDRIVISGKGLPGRHGGPAGDLVFQLAFPKQEPRDGANMFANVRISAEEAETGTVVPVDYSGGTITVDIPAGTKDGTMIELAGKGQPGQYGGREGKLVVTVLVAPGLPQRGADYVTSIKLTPEEARLGCTKEFLSPSGEKFTIQIPAGSQDAAKLPPKMGLGYPGRFGGQSGDAIVTVQIEWPAAKDRAHTLELTPEEAKAGAVKVLTGPWGKLEFAVPPGSVAGKVARVKGMGEPGPPGRPAGDLLVTYSINDPAAADEPTQLERLRKDLAAAEEELKKVPPLGLALALPILYPLGVYLLWVAAEWIVHLSFVPRALTQFLEGKLVGLAWILAIVLFLGGILMLVESIRATNRRAKLVGELKRAEKQ